MASSAGTSPPGRLRNLAGSRTLLKPSEYGARRGSTDAASSLPQYGARMATGTTRTHRARSARAFSTVGRIKAGGGKA